MISRKRYTLYQMVAVGVGPGMRIVIGDDGSPSFRGSDRDTVLNLARLRLRLKDRKEEDLQQIQHWLDLMDGTLAAEELEARATRAAARRLQEARKRLRKHPYAIQPAEDEILRQERQRAAGKDRSGDQ